MNPDSTILEDILCSSSSREIIHSGGSHVSPALNIDSAAAGQNLTPRLNHIYCSPCAALAWLEVDNSYLPCPATVQITRATTRLCSMVRLVLPLLENDIIAFLLSRQV